MIFAPLVIGIVLFTIKSHDRPTVIKVALSGSIAVFLYSLSLLWSYDSSDGSAIFQCVRKTPWINIGGYTTVSYHVGIDGISLWLVILTTFLTPITILSTYGSRIKNYREFLFALLALETAVLGVFLSLDLVLFYIFWELVLIPMFFIIGLWGTGERIKSAMKFILFTMLGSFLMLVGILVLFHVSELKTFDITRLYTDSGLMQLGLQSQSWLFWAFFVAFAVKVPIFPLHTWLPDAHTDAPTAGSVMLAALLLKLGTFGLLRFCMPMFPLAAQHFAVFICVLAVIGIIYGAWVATVQRDVKRLVAYSSISHLGLVVLGLFVFTHNSITGAVLQMVNHGLTTGALFLIVGMLYERRHSRLIADFGGIIRVMPFFGVIFWIITFASIGLPGLNNFVGEFLVILGIFETATGSNIIFGMLAITGVIWCAVYMLWMFQRVMLGEIVHDENKSLKDISRIEKIVLIPIVTAVFFIGLFSPVLTSKMSASIAYALDLSTRAMASGEFGEIAMGVDSSHERINDTSDFEFSFDNSAAFEKIASVQSEGSDAQ